MRLAKIRFDRNQRKELGKALYSAANIILAIIVLGPFVTEESFKMANMIFGFIMWIILFIVSTLLNKEK